MLYLMDLLLNLVYFRHDFDPRWGGPKNPCDKEGLMSYGDFRPDKWSGCSNYDFTTYYRNIGKWCLNGMKKLP